MILVHIRWRVPRDMPAILAIESASFAYPLGEDALLAHLRERNCIPMVAEHGERVVGFMVYNLHKTRIEIIDFAVHPAFRRQGIGRQMVAKLINKLSSHQRTLLTLAVRETNLPGQLFFRSQGFRATSVVREGYGNTGESAYVMEYVLDQPESTPTTAATCHGWER